MRNGTSVAVCLVGCALIFAGCGPAVQSAPFAQAASRPSDHEIRIYSTTDPRCAYEELGLVSGERKHAWVSVEELMFALRRRAREMGGDAIVGLQEPRRGGDDETLVVGRTVSLSSLGAFSGTVVRFTEAEADCAD